MTINWEEFDNLIKNNKYPLVLIKKFFSALHTINDYYASIMLRYIIKNNIDLFYNNPFYILCNHIDKDEYSETIYILETFYYLVKDKIIILNDIKIWYSYFNNKLFWNKNVEDQIKELYRKKEMIQANFDNSKGGIPFGIKMIPIIKNDNMNIKFDTLKSASDRLRNVYKIMGHRFLENVGITIITAEDFFNLDNDQVINYTNHVFIKVTELLTKTISLFENLNMNNLKFENLINPLFVNIEEDTIMNDEIEDLSYLFIT